MNDYFAPNSWYEPDFIHETPMTTREVELEEEFAQLNDSFRDMINLMAEEKEIHLSEFYDVLNDVAKKLNFKVERDTVFKIWDRMI